jgi:hypothetical protein
MRIASAAMKSLSIYGHSFPSEEVILGNHVKNKHSFKTSSSENPFFLSPSPPPPRQH